MTEITYFMVVPFDYVDDGVVAGEPAGCPSPAAAIQRAQGVRSSFGPTRTGLPEVRRDRSRTFSVSQNSIFTNSVAHSLRGPPHFSATVSVGEVIAR